MDQTPPEIPAQRVDDDGDFAADGDDSDVAVYKGAKDKHIPTGGGKGRERRRKEKMNGMEKGWGAF